MVLRLTMVGLIALSLAAWARSFQPPQSRIAPLEAARGLVRAAGAVERDLLNGGTGGFAYYDPGCADRSIVRAGPILTDFRVSAPTSRLPGKTVQLQYYDRSLAATDRVALLWDWVRMRLGYALGRRDAVPITLMLIVVHDPGCTPTLALDWGKAFDPLPLAPPET